MRALAHCRRPPPIGFTLMELMIVIAVSSALAALLLPALGQARQRALQTDCLSRLKQWSMAAVLYADDNDNIFPREGFHPNGKVFLNNWAQIQDERSNDVWYNALSNYVNCPPASRYANDPNAKDFYDRSSFFHCPSARFPPEADNDLVAHFSLAFNSQFVDPGTPPQFSYMEIRDPSKTVCFTENLLRGEKRVDELQSHSDLGQPASDALRFAGLRHGAKGNLAFADARVESYSGNRVVATRGPNRGGIIYPQMEIIWNPRVP